MRSNKTLGVDVWSGLLLVMFGAGGVWFALKLRLGTAINMGPGYFPLIIYACIIVLGLVIAVRGITTPQQAFGRILWRPLLVVTAAVLAFWLLIEPAGFVIAAAVLMLTAIAAQGRLSGFQSLLFTAVAVLFATLLFVIALKLPFPLWPSFE